VTSRCARDAQKVSGASLRGLDAFAFFVADIQTGWGPFVAAYLTSVGWVQFDIGLILTIGTMAGFVLQVPMGAVVDAMPAKRLLAATAVACISASALLLAGWPSFGPVVVAKLLHAVASCLIGPTMAAISLGLVGYALLSVRLGRNARFLSLGNAIAAAAMGVIGHYFTNRAIFLFTAAMLQWSRVAWLQGCNLVVGASCCGEAQEFFSRLTPPLPATQAPSKGGVCYKSGREKFPTQKFTAAVRESWIRTASR
jgi:hypothetical protein